MQNKQKQDRDLFKCFKKLIKSACDYGQSILKQICGTCVIQDDKSNDKPFNVETDIESTKTSNKTTQKTVPEEFASQSTVSTQNTAQTHFTPAPTSIKQSPTKKRKKISKKKPIKKSSAKK